MGRLEIVVDELIVRGLAPPDARAAAAAIEAHLTALARHSDAVIPARTEVFRRLPAVASPVGDPAQLGAEVAGAVWSALSPGGGP